MSPLPPLPEQFLDITREFDVNLRDIYALYLQSYFAKSAHKLKDHYQEYPLRGGIMKWT